MAERNIALGINSTRVRPTMFEIACNGLGDCCTRDVTAPSYFTTNSTHSDNGSILRFPMGHEHVAQKEKAHERAAGFLLSAGRTGRTRLGSELFPREWSRGNSFVLRRLVRLAKEHSLRHSSQHGDVAEWLKAAVC
ncbi:MAG TPA: hypothetical protein PL193_16605 [Xanthobacteraceae bacterium]|nr:hypothetical protein [Xanthobacteraceae bacterium]